MGPLVGLGVLAASYYLRNNNYTRNNYTRRENICLRIMALATVVGLVAIYEYKRANPPPLNNPCSIQVRETGLTCPPISQLKDYLQNIPADSSTCKTFQTFDSVIGFSCENNFENDLHKSCSKTPSKPAMWGYRPYGKYGIPSLAHRFEYSNVFDHKEVDTFFLEPGNDVKTVYAAKCGKRFSGPLDDTNDKNFESIYSSFLEGDEILDIDSNTYQLKV